jgi:hypothetical protein
VAVGGVTQAVSNGRRATAGRGKHFDALGFRTGHALQEGRAIEDKDYYDARLEIQKQVRPRAPGCGGGGGGLLHGWAGFGGGGQAARPSR